MNIFGKNAILTKIFPGILWGSLHALKERYVNMPVSKIFPKVQPNEAKIDFSDQTMKLYGFPPKKDYVKIEKHVRTSKNGFKSLHRPSIIFRNQYPMGSQKILIIN